MLSVIPTLIALIDREKTGAGAHVEASLLGAAVLAASEMTLDVASGQLNSMCESYGLNGLAPGYAVYPTSSGHVAVAAVAPAARTSLERAMDAGPERDLSTCFAALDTGEVLKRLDAAGVPAEEVRPSQEASFLSDPVNREIGLAMVHDHPMYGRLAQIGSLWDTGSALAKLDRPAPTLGQHTREFLTELGVSDAEIRTLAASGVIAGDALI
jgi:crotonobetainyl-CoA:carnitine CoA-transferase CaiB-like acyl-CoA transferase